MTTRIRSLIVAGAAILATLPAWAQTASDFGPRYGYGPMWGGWGWGWFPGMMLGPLIMLIFVAGTIALVVWLMRGFGHVDHRGSTALDILEQRFARGEIDKAEFNDKRKLLRS